MIGVVGVVGIIVLLGGASAWGADGVVWRVDFSQEEDAGRMSGPGSVMSGDGGVVAVHLSDESQRERRGWAVILDGKSGERRRTIEPEAAGESVSVVSLSPNGTLAAVARYGPRTGEVRLEVVRLEDGKVLAKRDLLNTTSVSFTPGGKLLVPLPWGDGPTPSRFEVIDPRTGEATATIALPQYTRPVERFSPDGRWMAAMDGNDLRRAEVRDLTTGERVTQIVLDKGERFSGEVVFLPDGKRLRGVTRLGAVLTWSLPEGKLLSRDEPQDNILREPRLDARGEHLYLGSQQRVPVDGLETEEVWRADLGPRMHWDPTQAKGGRMLATTETSVEPSVLMMLEVPGDEAWEAVKSVEKAPAADVPEASLTLKPSAAGEGVKPGDQANAEPEPTPEQLRDAGWWAERAMEHAAGASPEVRADLYWMMAGIAAEAGEVDTALAAMRLTEENRADPEPAFIAEGRRRQRVDMWSHAARWLARRGEVERARALAESPDLTPTDRELLNAAVGVGLLQGGAREAGIAAVAEMPAIMERRSGESTRMWVAAIAGLIEAGAWEEASAMVDRLDANARQTIYIEQLAKGRARQGEVDEAVRLIERTDERQRDTLWYTVPTAAAEAGQVEAARELLRRTPNEAVNMVTLTVAEALAKRGEFEAAEQIAEGVLHGERDERYRIA